MTSQQTLPGIDPHKFHVTQEGELLDPTGYFILKRGDALAISTLRSYAANALTILDLERMGMIKLTGPEIDHLIQLSDDVTQMADNWEHDSDLKLPS